MDIFIIGIILISILTKYLNIIYKEIQKMDEIYYSSSEDGLSNEYKADKINNYYMQKQKDNHNDDAENSHDSTIVKEIKRLYSRLSHLNDCADLDKGINNIMPFMSCKEYRIMIKESAYYEINKFISSVDNMNKQYTANLVLNHVIKKDHMIMSLTIDDKYPVSTLWILSQVWTRLHAHDNKENIDKLKESLLDQLLDCSMEIPEEQLNLLVQRAILMGQNIDEIFENFIKYKPICPVGMANRFMQVFTLLDADPVLSTPVKDKQEYMNEALTTSYAVLQECFTSFKMDDVSKTSEELYNSLESDLTSEELDIVRRFEKYVKLKIRSKLTNDYGGILSIQTLHEIIDIAESGISD